MSTTSHFNLGSPINTALFIFILYSVQKIILPTIPDTKGNRKEPTATEFKSGYTWSPKTHPPTVLFKTYTPKTLEPFNGVDNPRILLAINGTVFDVSAGRNFYGPNGMYGNFAGRDASRGMAKQSFDKDSTLSILIAYPLLPLRCPLPTPVSNIEMLTPVDQPLDKLTNLAPDEIENMKGWIDHFSNKYLVCGRLVENNAV